MRAMACTVSPTTVPPRSATARGLIGHLGVLGVVSDRRGDLFQRGRGLFETGGLHFGPLRQIGRAGCDLGRCVGDFARRVDDGRDGLLKLGGGLVEVVLDLLIVLRQPVIEPHRQISGR